MIVVDSCVWVSYFNGVEDSHARRLVRAIDSREDLAIVPVIVTEVLQGFRSERGFESARRLLVLLPSLTLDIAGHVRAARLFRDMKRRGVTIRGAVDCIIAQTCLDIDCELLTADVDFVKMAAGSALRLCGV